MCSCHKRVSGFMGLNGQILSCSWKYRMSTNGGLGQLIEPSSWGWYSSSHGNSYANLGHQDAVASLYGQKYITDGTHPCLPFMRSRRGTIITLSLVSICNIVCKHLSNDFTMVQVHATWKMAELTMDVSNNLRGETIFHFLVIIM